MNPAVATVIVAAVGVIGGLAGAALSAFLNRDRTEVELTDKLTAIADRQVSRLEAELARVEERLDITEHRLQAAEDRERLLAAALRAAVRALGDPAALEAAIIAAKELL